MAETSSPTDTMMLRELEPRVGELLQTHLGRSKEWFPHELVPFDEGRTFVPGVEWDPTESRVDEATRSALYVNLLTEDNLPYYFRTIESMFGRENAWGEWNRRWTAEEGRHSIVIRDYLTVTRAIDLVALERARMKQVSLGQVPEPSSVPDGIVYVALQELATRIAHYNTGKRMATHSDHAGNEVMKRVGNDENLHYLFYRDLGSAAIELDPSSMVLAMDRQVKDFEMPGTGIEGFTEHAKIISHVGIYDYQIHYDEILKPVILGKWKLEALEGLSAEAEVARDNLMHFLGRLAKAAKRLAARKAEKAEIRA